MTFFLLFNSLPDEVIKNMSAWKMINEDNPLANHKFYENISSSERVNVKLTCTLYADTKRKDWHKHGINCNKLVPTLYSLQEGHKCWFLFLYFYNHHPSLLCQFRRNFVARLARGCRRQNRNVLRQQTVTQCFQQSFVA